MNILSLLSAILATAFLIGGIYCLTRNRKSELNLFSLLVLLSLGWWSFCYAFFFSAETDADAWRWHHLAALGWTGFIAETTYYFIVLTGFHNRMKKLWIQIAYYALPTALLLHNLLGDNTSLAVAMTKSELGGQWAYVNAPDNIWLWLYLFCLMVYFGFAFCLLLRWAQKVRHPLKKRMAVLFIVLDAMTIMVGLITDVYSPLTNASIPSAANLGTALFGAGYFLIIIHYDVFNIRHVVDDREIIEHSMEALMVTDEFGEILDANRACAELLKASRERLVGSMSTAYFSNTVCIDMTEQMYTSGSVTGIELSLDLDEGGKKQLLVSGSVIRDRQKKYMGTVFSLRDITQLNDLKEQYRLKSDEYERLAYVDTLTGRPNRRKTFEYLFECVKKYNENGTDFFVLYMDLDDFKSVNDCYGHNIGDQFLRAASERMGQCLFGALRFLGRLGGDEFLIVGFLENGDETVSSCKQRIYEAFSEDFVFGDTHIQGGVSIGYALFSAYGDVDSMIYHADERMYLMKNGYSGRDIPKLKGRAHERI